MLLRLKVKQKYKLQALVSRLYNPFLDLIAPGYLIGLLNLLCEPKLLNTSTLVTFRTVDPSPGRLRLDPLPNLSTPCLRKVPGPTTPYQNPTIQKNLPLPLQHKSNSQFDFLNTVSFQR